LALLVAFLAVEYRSPGPILPLALFRSRNFTAVNLLTLLLYSALGGALFFVPFALIQVHGYPATVAGAAFLPFTIIMAGLSRWAGGLLDRFGARLPLIIGPAIAAMGFGLMALTVPRGSYLVFLIPIVVLGFGMVISVAPLTTTVMNSVPAHQAGVASGINNAVASVANLLAVAILGAVALTVLDHALNRQLLTSGLSSPVRQALERARDSFVIEPSLSGIQGTDRHVAEAIIKGALAEGIQVVMFVASGLALASAAVGSLISRSIDRPR
jgi:MFS family permease